jgi:hypothetical protein
LSYLSTLRAGISPEQLQNVNCAQACMNCTVSSAHSNSQAFVWVPLPDKFMLPAIRVYKHCMLEHYRHKKIIPGQGVWHIKL